MFCVDEQALIKLFDSFHLCTYNNGGKSHCGGNAGGPLVMVDDQYGRYTYHIIDIEYSPPLIFYKVHSDCFG